MFVLVIWFFHSFFHMYCCMLKSFFGFTKKTREKKVKDNNWRLKFISWRTSKKTCQKRIMTNDSSVQNHINNKRLSKSNPIKTSGKHLQDFISKHLQDFTSILAIRHWNGMKYIDACVTLHSWMF